MCRKLVFSLGISYITFRDRLYHLWADVAVSTSEAYQYIWRAVGTPGDNCYVCGHCMCEEGMVITSVEVLGCLEIF